MSTFMDETVCFTDKVWIVWAEAEAEGSYNYTFYPLRDRWNPTPQVEIPRNVAGMIIARADSNYPILIIDGYGLDGVIDSFMTKSVSVTSVYAAFGDFPRKVYGGPKRDSVKEFMEAVKNGEKF